MDNSALTSLGLTSFIVELKCYQCQLHWDSDNPPHGHCPLGWGSEGKGRRANWVPGELHFVSCSPHICHTSLTRLCANVNPFMCMLFSSVISSQRQQQQQQQQQKTTDNSDKRTVDSDELKSLSTRQNHSRWLRQLGKTAWLANRSTSEGRDLVILCKGYS